MDGDRKYKQRGYQESDRDRNSNGNGHARHDDRPRPQGPRPSIDITGPRLPRLVQAVTASRCFNCATTLPAGTDFKGNCPKCGTALHCCKQCSHFEPSTRFQCLKPIPVRIAVKDQANECELFSPRVTVAREMTQSQQAPAPARGSGPMGVPLAQEVRRPSDTRAAFDNLFKK
jgi:hypothetical protein